MEHLKMMAVSRLMLDNVPNLQASWVTQGAKIAQTSLEFGVNDFGQTMMEENVVSAAGAKHAMDAREICRLIRNAGYTPRLRNAYYEDMGDPEEVLPSRLPLVPETGASELSSRPTSGRRVPAAGQATR